MEFSLNYAHFKRNKTALKLTPIMMTICEIRTKTGCMVYSIRIPYTFLYNNIHVLNAYTTNRQSNLIYAQYNIIH